MTKRIANVFFIQAVLVFLVFGICCADSSLLDNGDGTFSMENGIYLRYSGRGRGFQIIIFPGTDWQAV